jgi:hypothetical protein
VEFWNVGSFREFHASTKFGWEDVISLATLRDNKEALLSDNTLRTRVSVEMYCDPARFTEEAMKQERVDFAQLMTQDIFRLRSATGTADVHLECEGKVFPVHKLILACKFHYMTSREWDLIFSD